MGLLLYLLSRLLYALFAPVGFGYACAAAFRRHGWKGLKALDDKLLRLAIGRDILGGVACAEWFNRALLRPDAPLKFGARWITISEVLGVNQRYRALSLTGRRLKNLLGVFEPGHTRKAAADNSLTP
jgi:hypothetical protein